MNKFLDEGEPLLERLPATGSPVRTDTAQATGTGEPATYLEMGTAKEDKRRRKAKKPVRPGLGPDTSKPPCKKVKVIRRERRAQKMKSQAVQQGKPQPTR